MSKIRESNYKLRLRNKWLQTSKWSRSKLNEQFRILDMHQAVGFCLKPINKMVVTSRTKTKRIPTSNKFSIHANLLSSKVRLSWQSQLMTLMSTQQHQLAKHIQSTRLQTPSQTHNQYSSPSQLKKSFHKETKRYSFNKQISIKSHSKWLRNL